MNSGQWCLVHDCHQDDPAHDYSYEVCEGHHREARICYNVRDMTERADTPEPHEFLVDADGGTNHWLKSEWTFEDIRDEWDWLPLKPDSLIEVWLRPRWTTEEERANPDVLYDLFGDYSEMDTTVYYEPAKPGDPGAVAYWYLP